MRKTFKRSFSLFYLLGIYVIFQFFWWAYYLIDLNQQVLNLKLYSPTHDASAQLLRDQYAKKIYMIVGEGAVFFLFLLFGMYKLRLYLKREKKLFQLQNNFMLSVTHELKSPIAAIQLHLETLQKRSLDPEKQNLIIAKSLEEGDRLNHLTENIILASRIESGKEFFHFEEVNFSELIRKSSASIAESIGRNHQLNIDVPKDVKLFGDPFALDVLFRNLYENAIKYSPENSIIEVALSETNDQVILKVADHGEGISDEEKKQVLKKFYRVGSEEIRQTKGTGLGLFLVNEIAHLHNARVILRDNQPKGTIFSVLFKK